MKKLWTALLCGCGIDPFETPSAYDQQRYLCDDLDQLEAEADACLEMPEEANCTGVISFEGKVQQARIRVDTELQRSFVREAENGDGDQVLSRVEISGAAPYFHFDIAISSIGTPIPWPDETEKPWVVDFDTPIPETALDFKDGLGAVQWYIRAGSDTAMLTSNPGEGTGTIEVGVVSDERVELRFGGSIGPVDDELYACAIVFPQPVPSP